MSTEAIVDLARHAGIAVEWTDAAGEPQRVAADALRPILEALGFACDTPANIAESRRQAAAAATSGIPPMITADAGEPIELPVAGDRRATLILEDGMRADVLLEARGPGRALLAAVSRPGYHVLEIGDRRITLAVAPKRCFTAADVAQTKKLWGLSVQLYGLRRAGDGGIGDTTALAMLAKSAAERGADSIAISPVHALFGAVPSYSPYSPSNRLLLNPLLADPATLFGDDRVAAVIDAMQLAPERARLEALALIDWPAAAAQKLALLRRLFDDIWPKLQQDPDDGLVTDLLQFRQSGGDILERHARFEALHADFMQREPSYANWEVWPAALKEPDGPAVAAFAAAHQRDVMFHIFLQWVADRSLAAAQTAARSAGMRVGLIADLAVGMESGGSHAWSRQSDILKRLNIGAPPDLFNPKGQNWGLTTFAPQALRDGGFEPFLATLRAATRHAGGLRIDHVLGLTRLWVVPEGASPSDGAYLAYPFDDLLRIIRLESYRHRAIVIGEDLGTVPSGFRKRLAESGIAGMDVLWFAKADDHFLAPQAWRRDAVAMTSTHDLPTVAGWWRGVDISLRARHALLGGSSVNEEVQVRENDREDLWRAVRAADVSATPAPAPDDPAPAVDAAVAFVAVTPAPLVLLPLEDALGLEAQPNLPGTIDQHPNWRRRYPVAAGDVFDDPAVDARARILAGRGSQ